MAQFSVNAQRFDPYKNFKFRMKWDGRYVAGASEVGSLKRASEVVKHLEGGDPSSSRKAPGRTEYQAISIERGVTHDRDFEHYPTGAGAARHARPRGCGLVVLARGGTSRGSKEQLGGATFKWSREIRLTELPRAETHP
jgi:phage tail-like protein